MDGPLIHPLADVGAATIGAGTRIWQFVVILPQARIGRDCNICSHCFIESDVVIGDRVTIKNGVQVWNGARIGNDVFVGPNVSFTNDRLPRSMNRDFVAVPLHIGRNASIGAGAVILPGTRIGEGAMVAAGSVVTKDVPPGALVRGNPARTVGEARHER